MMEKCGKFCILEHAEKGFKFTPSGQEICEFYLKLKIHGIKLPCTHLIADKNLYEDYSTPWEILKTDDSCWSSLAESSNRNNNTNKKTKKVIYVFTMLKKKGERVLRKAGCGTWTGQHKKEVTNEGGDLIGYDRLLTFKIDDDDDKKMNDDLIGNWTMHEYSLQPNDYNYAICKITKEEDARDEKLVGSIYNQSMVDASMVDEQLSLHNYVEFSDNNLDSDVALQEFPHQNMFKQEDFVQVQPLLDQEWGSYMETLNQLLELQEEEREVCDRNNIEKHFPNEIDALAVQELSEENMINELAQPQGIEDNGTDKLYTYHASDPLFKPPKDYEEPKDMHGYCPLPDDNQVLLAELEHQQVLLAEQEHQQVLLVEQEQPQQQRERIAFVRHLAENFNYYYDQQQQQLEGGQNNSLGKRKNLSYHEEEFSNNKKQQHSFFCSLY